MYRYEVTSTVKSDIEGVIGKPVFYDADGKYYIDSPNQSKAFQYFDAATDAWKSETLDQICQGLYTEDFADKSTEVEYTPADTVSVTNSPAFADKTIGDKSLYSRMAGKKFTLTTGSNDCIYTIPFAAMKFSGIEVINAEAGDELDLFVLDSTTGTYTTVNNYVLNQFGYEVYPAKDYYVHESNYDADLYINMQIKAVYESVSAKDVYLNYILHELK